MILISNLSHHRQNPPRPNRKGKKSGKTRISAEEQLKTLELYILYQNTNRVGGELGISGAAVRDRLFSLGVELKPTGFSTATVESVNGEEKLRSILADLRHRAQSPGEVGSL